MGRRDNDRAECIEGGRGGSGGDRCLLVLALISLVLLLFLLALNPFVLLSFLLFLLPHRGSDGVRWSVRMGASRIGTHVRNGEWRQRGAGAASTGAAGAAGAWTAMAHRVAGRNAGVAGRNAGDALGAAAEERRPAPRTPVAGGHTTQLACALYRRRQSCGHRHGLGRWRLRPLRPLYALHLPRLLSLPRYFVLRPFTVDAAGGVKTFCAALRRRCA